MSYAFLRQIPDGYLESYVDTGIGNDPEPKRLKDVVKGTFNNLVDENLQDSANATDEEPPF